MPEQVQYYVEIAQRTDGYHGRIHQGDPAHARPLTDLQLGPDAAVGIKGTAYRLGALVEALIRYHQDDLRTAYDERGQLEIGRYLYHQVFGTLEAIERRHLRDTSVDVRIVTEDEHIARLPWVLLADGGIFLATAGWSVSLGRTLNNEPCELPPSPRILVVAPQPVGVPETKAEWYLEELETLLSGADPRHSRGRALRVVSTWDACTAALADFRPHIVYYYGHGIGDPHKSHLVFACEPGNSRLDIPIADLAVCLRNMPDGPPLVVYLNCCQGDAGGLLGAGQALGEHVPAVLTNRTIAHINAAHAQGLAFWRSVLLDGILPHIAVAKMYSKLGLSLGDTHWMTPIVHCHYSTWRANPPQPRSPLEHESHWRFKLDRVKQFGQVFYETQNMLQRRRPRSLAYVWYGQPGQGVELFHQRLTVELRDSLRDTQFYEVLPKWPDALDAPARAFEDMLAEAFEVNTLDHIPGRIRTQSRGVSRRQTLVYIRHLPVQSSKLITPAVLKCYLEWWDMHFMPLLEGQVFALLGVSFVIGKPATFLRVLTERAHVSALPLASTVVRVLDEMDRVRKQDLLDFLHTHNILLPLSHRDRVLDDVLTRTGGDYDMTLEALKDIAARAWAQVDQGPEAVQVAAGDEDYN